MSQDLKDKVQPWKEPQIYTKAPRQKGVGHRKDKTGGLWDMGCEVPGGGQIGQGFGLGSDFFFFSLSVIGSCVHFLGLL